jgi:hypothetical protein
MRLQEAVSKDFKTALEEKVFEVATPLATSRHMEDAGSANRGIDSCCFVSRTWMASQLRRTDLLRVHGMRPDKGSHSLRKNPVTREEGDEYVIENKGNKRNDLHAIPAKKRVRERLR